MTSAANANANAVGGVLLAGGRARRFDGQDKGLLALAGRGLAARAAERLLAQTDGLCVVANRNREEYAKLGHAVAADSIGGFAGPLAGIHAGMSHWHGRREWVLCAACDTPFFPIDLRARLLAAAQSQNAPLAVAEAGGRAQPVFMLAKTNLRQNLASFLAGGDGKIDRWYANLPFAVAVFDSAAAFDNINTPQDLAQAEAKLQTEGSG